MYIEATVTEDGLIRPKSHLMIKSILTARGWIGKQVIVEITKYHKNRTNRQNRYVWGVVVPILRKWFLDTQGEKITKDQAYTYIRVGILGEKPVVKDIAGVEVITFESKRLSQRTTKEFAEDVETIVQVMAERGCVIPLPNEENLLTDFI